MMTSKHHYKGKVCYFPSTVYKNRFNRKNLLLLKKTYLLVSLHESINQTEGNKLVECVRTCLEKVNYAIAKHTTSYSISIAELL